LTSSRVLSSRRECSRLLLSRRNHRAFLQTFQVFQGSEESVGTHQVRSEALWEVFRRLSSSDQGSEEPNTEPRTSIEPPWKPSTSHCAIVRVRGPGRSRASLHQASEEPGIDLREASKLRRAPQLAAVRVSVPLEPLDERQSRIRHPKKPSTVHRPMSEPRRSLSASVHDASGIRRLPRQHFGLRRCPGWNPSVSIRPASKLRRAHPRTITHVEAPRSCRTSVSATSELRRAPL